MPFPLSPQSIDAIADIISGGGGHDTTPPIGIYRSGPKIEKFMRACNVAFTVNGSRVPSLVQCLINLNNGFEADQALPRIIEAAADPRDFIHEPERHIAVLDHLNRALRFDGFEVQQQGGRMRLVEAGKNVPVLAELAGLSEVIDFDTVSRDLERALASSQTDPEDAVTAACSTVESVCRSILIELGLPLPAKKDVQGLYNAVKQPLGLSPDRSDLEPLIAGDVRQILSGLATVIGGVGALRTHGGDAQSATAAHVKYTFLFLANFVPNFVQARLLPAQAEKAARACTQCRKSAPRADLTSFGKCSAQGAQCNASRVLCTAHHVLWTVPCAPCSTASGERPMVCAACIARGAGWSTSNAECVAFPALWTMPHVACLASSGDRIAQTG